MKLPYPLARRLSSWGAVAFAALAAAGLAAILLKVEPVQVISLATVIAVVFAAACVAWFARLKSLARHPFRATRARHTVTFRGRDMREDGVMLAGASVASETEFEALAAGQKSVRLQKFVVEPTALDPDDLLQDWSYTARIGGAEQAAQPYLSPSRSLQLDVTLQVPPQPGARFDISESLSFDVFLDAPARLVFQPSYPSGPQTIEILFDGPRPLRPRYRIERGFGQSESGDLAAEGPRLGFVWEHAAPGEQLVLDWEWDPESLPEPQSETDRLIAEARKRQDEIQKALATQLLEEEGAGEGDGESAEDHAIIRAAHLRETLVSGHAPPLPGDAGFADDDMDDTTPAEEHPIIKAARAREKLYKKDGES